MSGSGAISYPAGFVDKDDELKHVWYVYGRDGARSGFRQDLPPPSQVELMNSGLFTQCGINADKTTKETKENHTEHCGPFRIDHWSAPIWFPIRDTDVSDLPPR